LALGAWRADAAHAQDQTVTGNLTVSGAATVQGGTLLLGSPNGLPGDAGLAVHYDDEGASGSPDQIQFAAVRPQTSWLWLYTASGGAVQPQMWLDDSNTLTLYDRAGTPNVAIQLNPSGTSLFTQSLCVNGTDNRMPNQTLADPSSLLTASLADGRYLSLGAAAAYLTQGAADNRYVANSASGIHVQVLSSTSASGYYIYTAGTVAAPGGSATAAGATAGVNATASGYWSTASGYGSRTGAARALASGYHAVALAPDSTASGSQSTAEDWGAVASGTESHAIGYSSVASGTYSRATGAQCIAVGDSSYASGNESAALGNRSIAAGYGSVANGYDSTANGDYSVASGSDSLANGKFSIAGGWGTTAAGYAQFVVGSFNAPQGDPENWVGTDDLFQVGNGGYQRPSNAFTVKKNGDAVLSGTLTTTGLVANGPVRIMPQGDLSMGAYTAGQ
jgi:hypothetical protein